jgi:DNA-binding response OmpR family regulator
MQKATILIVDDELVVRRVLGDVLARAGYTVELAGNGQEALARLAHPGIDLVLLDLQLGDIDGVQVMEQARKRWADLPIVMLTAHGSLTSAIAAVRYAAADYLLKPISLDELRTRVAAVLAAYANTHARQERLKAVYNQMHSLLVGEGILHEAEAGAPAGPTGSSFHVIGSLRLDERKHTVTMHGQPVDVTPIEFAILLELIIQPSVVVSCSQLARAANTVVSDEEEARQIIRPHIVRLRRKLEAYPQQPKYLLSVRGLGYRWSADGPDDH